jgi:hypothetical protein
MVNPKPKYQPAVDTRRPEEKVEATDVSLRWAAWGAVAVIAFIIVVIFCVALGLDVFGGGTPSAFKSSYFKHSSLEAPSGPRLHIEPHDELMNVRHREEQKLSGYGWVNRKAGIVHIPIERAMHVMAEQYRRAHPQKAKQAAKHKRPHPLAAPLQEVPHSMMLGKPRRHDHRTHGQRAGSGDTGQE